MLIRKMMVGAGVVGLVGLIGCDRGEVSTYSVSDEPAPAQAMPTDGSGTDPHAGMEMSRPTVVWGELPGGWTQSPQTSSMRLATFTISGEGGKTAELAIIPMGGSPGSEQQLVNMWRMQLGLPELAGTEAETQGEPVTVGGVEGRLYEMAGQAKGVPAMMLVASASKDGLNYFFKLIGDETVVAAQKQALMEFLKGVQFTTATPPTSPSQMMTPEPSAGETRWTAPDGWEELPPSQFLLAKYRVPGQGEAGAEVTVSMLGGSAGGLLPNVNRWRGQLNLGPVDEAGLAALESPIKAGSIDATLITLEGTDLRSGTPAKMLAVVVPLSTETWFFKMTGPIPVVDAQASRFRAFVNDARF